MVVEDWTHPRRTFDGNDIDAWDPEYIRRVLPIWRTALGTYFRSEVAKWGKMVDAIGIVAK